MKKFLFLFSIAVSLFSTAQTTYRTQVFNPKIKTLQIGIQNQKFVLPIINLNSSDILQISFDELSHESHAYSYKVIHCNANWTPSDLSTTEYINGFTTDNITDYRTSVNTTVLYTHYTFNLPNNEMSFKISGNYVVLIYEDNKTDNPVAEACFSIADPKVDVSANVRGNTDTELNGKLQQLDFNIDLKGFSVRDPATEIKVVVKQNDRIDNQVTDIKPTYFSNSTLNYINNKALIFESGYEYHRFDISSVYVGGEGVESIHWKEPYYQAVLFDNKVQKYRSYINEQDVNGKYVINLQGSTDPDVEADYMLVHFKLPTTQPFFDGQLYLGGEFNYNLMNDDVRLRYDGTDQAYVQAVLLKQGGYNYQYWFVPKNGSVASSERVTGSYWQTGNEYTIYVYYRAWGDRYDQLICVKDINN
jgi:hypothetical protein